MSVPDLQSFMLRHADLARPPEVADPQDRTSRQNLPTPVGARLVV